MSTKAGVGAALRLATVGTVIASESTRTLSMLEELWFSTRIVAVKVCPTVNWLEPMAMLVSSSRLETSS